MVEYQRALAPQKVENDAQKPKLWMDGKLGQHVITGRESFER